MPRKAKPLTREGEPSQKTEKGLEISIPKREDFDRFMGGLKKKPRKRT